MNIWINANLQAEPNDSRSVQNPLSVLAAEIDHQLVLDLGGEFLGGSGFENESPDREFEERS